MKTTFLQFGIAALIIGGFVVLTLKHNDTAAYVAMVTPVLAAVFVIDHVNRRSDQQDEALQQITHQTNGVLTERIRDAVAAALAEGDQPGP
ncbi:hypothetical protein AB0942_33340 [Streptomyces nodosus]|uniref:hypothetical protein n=1 Tax=Streptomyces nodosus TaxID=40318 RepID=UPI003453E314